VHDAALLGDRVAAQAQARRARPSREPPGRTVTSRIPSEGSAAPTAEPPPKAPVQATITCQAQPANTSSPPARTVHGSGRSLAAARSAPTP
jgi:hypothetical protein